MAQVPSTRWCPTQEQLMILEEMYRSGMRTPNASQIQHITTHLSYYGKIEGKNVFYWFQNHKARERQKIRRKITKQQQQTDSMQPFPQHTFQFNTLEDSSLPLHLCDDSSQIIYGHQMNNPQFLQHVEEFHDPSSLKTHEEASSSSSAARLPRHAYDWMTMMDPRFLEPPFCKSKSPKTLELFPTNSTGGNN